MKPSTRKGKVLRKDKLEALVQERTAQMIRANELLLVKIMERKRTEEALRKSEERFSKAFHMNPVPTTISKLGGPFIDVNESFLKLFGYSREEVIGRTATELGLYPNPAERDRIVQSLLHQTALREFEISMLTKSGEMRRLVGSLEVIELDGEKCILGWGHDVTERKKAQESLEQYATRLKGLSQRLIEIQEAERHHIARELHDEISQALTAVQLNLQSLQCLPQASPLAARLNESIGIVERILQQVRDLSLLLRPSILDDLGLVAALRSYVNQQAQRSGLAVEFIADPVELALSQELSTACFRVAQEAINNVLRHAQAERVRVRLHRHDDGLELVISDDGVGFDVGAAQAGAASHESLGLLGMHERVEILGGRIEIESAPNQGTTVLARFPVIS